MFETIGASGGSLFGKMKRGDPLMIRLEARAQPSAIMAYATPVLAVCC